MSILSKNYGQRQDAIITDCYVVMPEGVTDTEGNRRFCKIENAAWDTGATNTIISPEIVKVLGLVPSGKCAVSAYGGVLEANTYTIDLCFENGYKNANLQVMSGDDDNDFDYDVLIGMDVITKGDFCISTVNDQTVFSFRMPAEGIKL